jgi:hypothetical protein
VHGTLPGAMRRDSPFRLATARRSGRKWAVRWHCGGDAAREGPCDCELERRMSERNTCCAVSPLRPVSGLLRPHRGSLRIASIISSCSSRKSAIACRPKVTVQVVRSFAACRRGDRIKIYPPYTRARS